MRKYFAVTVTAALLLTVAANTYALLSADITDNYYTDDTYTTAVGWSEEYCDGTYDYSAPFTNYRYHEVTLCGRNGYSASCQYFDGSSWVDTTCPTPTTAQTRIHIPIGQ